MIRLTTEQAQQIEWALNGISNHPQLGAVINTGPCKEALATIRAARAQGQAEQEPVAFIGQGLLPIVPEDLEKLRKYEPGTATLYDTPLYAAPQPMKHEPVALPFNCWSTNDGDSWYEHPADAQLIYDTLGDDAKVGDEFEVTAGWTCVTARYRIVSQDDDDFEVECISHPQDNANPVRTKDLSDYEIAAAIGCSAGDIEKIGDARAVIAADRSKNK